MAMETNIDNDLVHKLTDAGATIPNEVRDRIVSQGKRAVPTLLAVVRDELGLDRMESRRPWLHAVTLLGDIKDPDTIEPLLEVLVERPLFYSEREPLVEALAGMGEPALEPALRAHAAVAPGAAPESALHPARFLTTLLARLGVRDERVLAILIAELSRNPEHGAPLLADYGDPRAVEPLHQAFDRVELGAGEPRRGIEMELFAIETALSRLGSELTAEQRGKYRQIEDARIQLRALAHQREKQVRKQHKVAQQKQRANNRKKSKQQKSSRKKNR
jgi:hypothetical protein